MSHLLPIDGYSRLSIHEGTPIPENELFRKLPRPRIDLRDPRTAQFFPLYVFLLKYTLHRFPYIPFHSY